MEQDDDHHGGGQDRTGLPAWTGEQQSHAVAALPPDPSVGDLGSPTRLLQTRSSLRDQLFAGDEHLAFGESYTIAMCMVVRSCCRSLAQKGFGTATAGQQATTDLQCRLSIPVELSASGVRRTTLCMCSSCVVARVNCG